MKLIDWVAILGALAWVPQLFSLVLNWLSKSQIRVISSRTAEVGFYNVRSTVQFTIGFFCFKERHCNI